MAGLGMPHALARAGVIRSLLDTLAGLYIPEATVRAFDADMWAVACVAAGIDQPSDETLAMVAVIYSAPRGPFPRALPAGWLADPCERVRAAAQGVLIIRAQREAARQCAAVAETR